MAVQSKLFLCMGAIVGCLISVNLCLGEPQTLPDGSTCGFKPREHWHAEFEAAIARGEITRPDPTALQVFPANQVAPAVFVPEPCLTPEQIFLFEDTSSLLLTNFSDGQLFDFMTTAANALQAAHGDVFDFVGFFVNFTPNHTLGAAFYLGWENDVQGIGRSLFNDRAIFGLAGNNIEGFVMMWNINSGFWQPGTGSSADFTRTVLGQEFEHRFAMFLPNLADGRSLQGDQVNCGRFFHWNWKVDGQGSGMEIADWVGSSPAVPQSLDNSFNTDILNSVFSYSDLYLMGYVTPAEMDAGNSELRYMNSSNCSSNYNGTITNFTSADIIATAGVRNPDAASEDKDYRTGWIMIHQPGSPPTSGQLTKAIGILEQHQTDWNVGTLGRGRMNNTTFADCNCNGVVDSTDITNGEVDADLNGIPDVCEIIAPPVLAAAPHNNLKQKYISIDASVNGAHPLAIKVRETTTGKVMWASAPISGPSVSDRSVLCDTPLVCSDVGAGQCACTGKADGDPCGSGACGLIDWGSFTTLHLTGCIIQPFGEYEITFVEDPLGTPVSSAIFPGSTACAWGDFQVDLVAPIDCEVGIGDIVEGINIATIGGTFPNTHGDVQGDIASGELDIGDIVAVINSVTVSPGATPGGYTVLSSCP